MSENNTPVDMEDLDKFEDEFFEREVAEEEMVEEVEEETDEAEDDPLATEDEDDDEAEDEDEEEDDEEESEPEPEVKAKPKNKTQRRIEQLLERERLANERATALEKRLADLEAGKSEVKKEEAPAAVGAPTPDDLNDKGEPKYPLGEFDPLFIRDLTKFTIEEETKVAREQAERERALRAEQEVKDAVVQQYAERFAEVEKEIPDLRENVAELQTAFQNVDPAYGDYLAMTIMSMENGPQIMNYLSQNIGEAQRIVASGPAAATLALGRLDARLAKPVEEEKRNKKEVSNAPPPPEDRSRGRSGRFTVSPDTDNLDAFEREFYPELRKRHG